MVSIPREAGADPVLAQLRDALGTRAVLSGSEIPERNLQDWSTLPPVRPLAVVRPDDPGGVAATVRIAGPLNAASGAACAP